MTQKKSLVVEIFTDGACSGNPGPGGYGAVLKYGETIKEISGGAPDTTNNRMEMIGVIEALKSLKRPCKVKITTDSKYVVKGMTEWIQGWIKKGWKNSRKKDVLNKDLWMKLLELAKQHEVKWLWVKGHDGHPENERCDELARDAIDKHR